MIPYGRQHITQSDIDKVTEVLRSDYLTQGPQVPLFERNIGAVTGAQYVVAGNSATSMLHIACLALGVSDQDIIWTSPITFVASANSGLYCGARVDFVDVDPHSGNMCPRALEKKLIEAKRDNKLPKVIIPVHLAGHSCDMEAIGCLAREYKVKIIEDAAHGIGGSYQGKPIGVCLHSDITVFSFHPVKIITSAEGGVATTNDESLEKSMRLYRSHGITQNKKELLRPNEGDWYYEQQRLGFNYRMSDIHAALGNSQVDRLDRVVKQRNDLALRYEKLLANVELKMVKPSSSSRSAYHLMIVLLPESVDRKMVFDSMRDAGIGVHVHYFPVHLQPYYLNLGFSENDFPHSECFYQRCLTLPLYPELSLDEQKYICDTIKALLI